MLKLTSEQLIQFLKKHLVFEDNPHVTLVPENFSTTNWKEAQVLSQQAYHKRQVSRANLLVETLVVGWWLN